MPIAARRKLACAYSDRFYRSVAALIDTQWCQHDTPQVVVEYGCGQGLLGYYLQQHGRVILTDVVDARESPAGANPFVQCHAERAPFRTGSVDVVILISVYHHLRDFEGFTAEAHRVLRPGGTLLIVEPIKRHSTTIALNVLAALVQRRHPHLLEPYGLALWINRRFILRQLGTRFALTSLTTIDHAFWGLNAIVPAWLLRAYGAICRWARLENTEVFVFRRIDMRDLYT